MSKTTILLIIVGGFIILDVITGLGKAFKNKEYNSTNMRKGLYHKCGSILCIVFSALVELSQRYIDIGVSLPILNVVCGYIILMEITSIVENICELNPEIMPDKLLQYFEKLKK